MLVLRAAIPLAVLALASALSARATECVWACSEDGSKCVQTWYRVGEIEYGRPGSRECAVKCTVLTGCRCATEGSCEAELLPAIRSRTPALAAEDAEAP
jgi:hypothetical protein